MRLAVRAEAANYINSNMFSEQDIVNRVDAFAARMQRGYFYRKVLRYPDWDYEP